jgi:hypothetical protein
MFGNWIRIKSKKLEPDPRKSQNSKALVRGSKQSRGGPGTLIMELEMELWRV